MKLHSKRAPKAPPSPKPEKRKVHKEMVRHAAHVAAVNKAHPEPMTLMHKREKMIHEDFARVYRKPPVTLGMIDKAAAAMAAWDNSDPFAYDRAALYVKQGYINPEEALTEMHKRTVARRVAREREGGAFRVR